MKYARAFAAVLTMLLYCVAAGAAPSPSPSVSASAGPTPASVVGPQGTLGMYTITSGQAEGYTMGDRVIVKRGEKTVCNAVVFSVSAHGAVISVFGDATPRHGDSVEFVRHKEGGTAEAYYPRVQNIGDENPGKLVKVPGPCVGRYTIYYFYTLSYPKCREIEPSFRKFFERARQEPEIAIVIVNVGYENSPMMAGNGVQYLPYLAVYNRAGRFVWWAGGHGTLEMLNRTDLMDYLHKM